MQKNYFTQLMIILTKRINFTTLKILAYLEIKQKSWKKSLKFNVAGVSTRLDKE